MIDRNDSRYLQAILAPIRVCAKYRPKFGQGANSGYSLDAFQERYQADPFYNWFGLDNPLMYAAHKAAGGMTSVYRQIGIGCEQLFRLGKDSKRQNADIANAAAAYTKGYLPCVIVLSEQIDSDVLIRYRVEK